VRWIKEKEKGKEVNEMSKKKLVIVLIMYLTIITGGQVFAATCPNIVGDWNLTGEYVVHNGGDGYGDIEGTLNIEDQNGCLFYGKLEREEPPPPATIPINGVIRRERGAWKIILTCPNGFRIGTLHENDSDNRRITVTGSGWDGLMGSPNWFMSSQCTFTQKK
jgi:hypothetical protein